MSRSQGRGDFALISVIFVMLIYMLQSTDPPCSRSYLRDEKIFFAQIFFKLHLLKNSELLSYSVWSRNVPESLSERDYSDTPPPQGSLSVSTFIWNSINSDQLKKNGYI